MKRVLITGAGTGFGHGAAMRLEEKGFDVIATVEIWVQVQTLRRQAAARAVSPGKRHALAIKGGRRSLIAVARSLTFQQRGEPRGLLIGRPNGCTKLGSSMPRPSRVIKNCPGQRNHVGVFRQNDCLGLFKTGNQSDCYYGEAD